MAERLQLKEVAVIGGGIMGAGIAAFFANNNVPSKIFDIKLELAKGAIDKLADPKAKVPLLYTPKYAKRISAFSVDDYAKELGSADMIVEVVPEIMSLKQKVFEQIDKFRRPDSIVATNTSGLSVNEMVRGCSESMKAHFLGTHYFNPVRFLPLVELIPSEQFDRDLLEELRVWFSDVAGKKPIIGKDTPNFVGNRVGIFFMMKTLELMNKYGLSIEEVDMVTGPPLGHPKTATFRLADMVGNDTLVHAAMNSYENCPEDEARDAFKPPAFLDKMVEMGLLGDKTRKGFYQKSKTPDGQRQILVLDLETFEYRPKETPRSDCVRVAKNFVSPMDRIISMATYSADDKYSRFSKELILASAAYALNRVGEIADDIATIDNALKWGFANEVGPIEVLDGFGLEKAASMMESVGVAVPKLMLEIMQKTDRVYEARVDGTVRYFDVATQAFTEMPSPEGAINLAALKETGHIVRENLNARLIDIGDGVLCCELDAKMVPKMNPIDDYIISMLWQAQEEIASGRFKALVISNQAPNFSAGAQLQMILELSKAKRFKDIEEVSKQLQMANLSLYHANFPVVTAPHGMTLGGGLEVTFAGQKRVPYTELYCGLVEVGVGLIPAGGGCLGLLMQFIRTMAPKTPGPMPPVMKAFELIGFGKVSSSAAMAIDMGLLAKDNTVFAYNKDTQIAKAKQVALEMLENFEPIPKMELVLPGQGGYLVMEDSIDGFHKSGTITAHSAKIAKIHAHVLTGGEKASTVSTVSEEYILELERDAFVKLCAEPMSQERMAHMLKKGKPLIN